MAEQTFGKPIPFLFHCYECEKSHPLVEGGYVFEDTDARARDTKFWCIPCAIKVHGEDVVRKALQPRVPAVDHA